MKSPERGELLLRKGKELNQAPARGILERTKNDPKKSLALRTPPVTLIRVIVILSSALFSLNYFKGFFVSS